ncbi:pyridoxamine 5'-phosphate oxidase family protein [Chloroflexota bacterium]
MDIQDCIKFANENITGYFATTEGDQPRVRAVLLWFADDTGFYFQTQSPKAFCKQLKNNKKVEVCFYGSWPGATGKQMMRVSGEVEFLDDPALKDRCLQDRPFLRDLGTEKAEDVVVIFRIHTGEAYFWSRKYSMRESEIERIKF